MVATDRFGPPGSPGAARHRRAGPPLRTRIVTALLVLATVAAGALVVRLKPDQEHGGRPFLRPGTAGGVVDVGTFQVVVLDAAGGTKLKHPRNGLTLDTTGVWVLVRVRVTATREPVVLRYARLRDDRGRTFSATGRVPQPLTDGRALQPGVWVEGHIAFEVAGDAKELTLLLGEHSGLGPGLLTLAEVPIAAAVPRWLGQSTPLDVPDARLAA
ncbi:hypothetical protein ACQP1P_37595 [Dactylosporangium sp. CA-052675]|uniref:hypothetical protein n=1 Tax=Dactylosporangium sp. CA-052675 TaxID=3239927 RepID=UPI003D929479